MHIEKQTSNGVQLQNKRMQHSLLHVCMTLSQPTFTTDGVAENMCLLSKKSKPAGHNRGSGHSQPRLLCHGQSPHHASQLAAAAV